MHLSTARIWRGAENQVLQTILGLRRLGARAALVAHRDGELLRRLAGQPDLLALAPLGEWDLAAVWRLARTIRRLRPDVIHVHEPHGVSLAAAALALVRNPPLLVASRHVLWKTSGNRLSRWKYGRVDCFIAVCDAVRTALIDDGIDPRRIQRIYPAVDVARAAAAPPADLRAMLGLEAGTLLVGTVAALSPEKGLQHLINAAAIVVREVSQARFVICGEGALRRGLQNQVERLGLARYVVLAGFRDDVQKWLSAFDLVVLSSVQEGLPTSIIDAMAASKAAVATRVGGLSELVVDGQTGFLVPAADAPALARKITELLRDEALRGRMGTAGLERAREMFDVGDMVRNTLAAYEKLLAARAA